MVNIILGTSYSPDKVCKVAEKVGFAVSEIKNIEDVWQTPHHKLIDNLMIQIHPPAYFKGVEGIITELEFSNSNNENYSKSIDILKQIYTEIPDLKYRESYFIGNPSPIIELSDFLNYL